MELLISKPSGITSGAPATSLPRLDSVPLRIRRALRMLLDSYDYARDIGCEHWQFATEVEHFGGLGLTAADWRWLCLKGVVDHGRELTACGESIRTFRRGGALRINRRTCFVLTEVGEKSVRRLVEAVPAEAPAPEPTAAASHNGHSEKPRMPGLLLPTWDRDRQQLRLGAVVIKEFKVPAPNQEAILAAFQEESWPPRIDDPLPPLPEIEPKRRLHDTITSLNRNQRQPLIRFLGDGSGQGVRWDLYEPSGTNGDG